MAYNMESAGKFARKRRCPETGTERAFADSYECFPTENARTTDMFERIQEVS